MGVRTSVHDFRGGVVLSAVLAAGCSGGGVDSASGSATATTGPTTGTTVGTGTATSAGPGSATGSGTSSSGASSASGTTNGTSAGTSGTPKFDVGAETDLGTCVPGDPNCDEFCKPEFTEFVDPVIKCSWEESDIITTPLVADLEGDGEMDIVGLIYGGSEQGKLLVLRGTDCTERYRSPSPVFGAITQFAVADLDGDQNLEIIGIGPGGFGGAGNHAVVVTDRLGNVLATSPTASVTGVAAVYGGPAVANLDGQGPPEIVYGGMALRFDNGAFTVLWNQTVSGGNWGVLSGVADVDLDGVPEVVTGNRIFDGVTGADETPGNVAAMAAGYVAVADFDENTPEPEIVLVSSQSGQMGVLTVFHPVTGNVVLGPASFGGSLGGPPTVGDFDGDEKPEIAAAGYSGYHVFDPECDPNNLPAFCESAWVRWSSPTQDASSGSTGSTLFDFNGDGRPEVVYRDELKLRIYDGDTGDVLSQYDITSGTVLENPVVADVDLDGHAEIVVSSDNVQGTGPTQGIYVLEDPQDKWVAARSIWNQHTYHVTNVTPTGAIPAVETNNWTVWNNYRQQVGPEDKPCKPAPEG